LFVFQVINLRWEYFALLWTYVDVALIYMVLSAAVLRLTYYSAASGQVDKKLKQIESMPYQDFYSLAYALYKYDVAVAGVLFIGWIKVRLISQQ